MASQQQTVGATYNALTAGSKIVGTIIADTDFRVDGIIEGDLQCAGKVVIGEQGNMKGTVVCQSAEIQGHLEGKINVKQELKLHATANLQGEVKTKTLIVEPNAIFNGTCEMGKKAEEIAE